MVDLDLLESLGDGNSFKGMLGLALRKISSRRAPRLCLGSDGDGTAALEIQGMYARLFEYGRAVRVEKGRVS